MLYERERCIDFCVTQRYMLVTDGKSGPPWPHFFLRLSASLRQFPNSTFLKQRTNGGLYYAGK